MDKDKEKEPTSLTKNESKPTILDWAFLGLYFGIKGTWKTGVFLTDRIEQASKFSWWLAKPVIEHAIIPGAVWGAKQTARGSQRLFRWTETQYKKPISIDVKGEKHKYSLKVKLGNIGLIGAIATSSVISTFYPRVVDAAQAAAETYHNGNEFLENLSRELAYKGDQSQEVQINGAKSTATPVSGQESASTPPPAKITEPTTKASETTKTPEYNTVSTFEDPFAGKRANEIAKELGMNAGSLFQVSEFTMNNLKKFNNGKLLRIFPPSVMQYKTQIEKLAAQYHISPNIVALIMTIESQGDSNAGSEAGAQGLMQVMPNHFPSTMGPKDMKEVLTNIEKGINVFITFYNYSKDNNTGYAFIMNRALMGYNGGGRGVTDTYPELIKEQMGETCFYGEHVTRFILTLEIAERLREEGYSDADIVKQLKSEEIEARAFALRESGFNGINSYLNVTQALADKDFNGNISYKNSYNKYKSTPSLKVNLPWSPGLVIFYQSGGRAFAGWDINKKDANYYQDPS